MNQIFIHVAGVVLAAVAVKVLRLNTKRVVHAQTQPISWVWKATALIGKFLFYYGLLVFVSNLLVMGPEATNTGVGASLLSVGLILWTIGGLVIYFKRN